MYRIKVLSNGVYHNVEKGNRYCFFRKSAISLANSFSKAKCDIVIEKLVGLGDNFFWSDAFEDTKICEDWTDNDEDNSKVLYRSLTRKEYKEML